MLLKTLAAACLLVAGDAWGQEARGAASARPEEVELARRFVETPTDPLWLERNCRSPWGGDPTEPCRLCP